MRTDRRTVVALAALAVVCVVGLSSCKGGASSDNNEEPADRLAAAKQSLDDADYIGFTIATDNLPDGVDGLVKADGTGTHDPAFTGEVDVQAALALSAPIISVDGKVYAKLPIVGWQDINPDDYGAPDPGALMDADSGLSSLFTKTVDPTAGDQVRDGDLVLDTIHGTVPGADVKALFPSAGDGDFDVTYSLTSDDTINAVDVTGPFYGSSGDITYHITFDLDADPVGIQPPS